MSTQMIKKRPTIYMPHWDVKLAMMFNKHNYRIVGMSSMAHDVVCFVDGPPVLPLFYGEVKLAHLKCDIARDRQDMFALRQLKRDIPKIGIGRGAHLLNIANGGSAWQLVTNHIGVHRTTDLSNGDEFWTSSNHEQLMLHSDGGDIIAIADSAREFKSPDLELFRRDLKNAIDPEVIYYGYSNSLCFQPPVQDGHKPTEDFFFRTLAEWPVLQNESVTFEE